VTNSWVLSRCCLALRRPKLAQVARRRRLEIAPEPSELDDEVKVCSTRARIRVCFT
jgi:hypothetical protein